jgi:hypothetical protein
LDRNTGKNDGINVECVPKRARENGKENGGNGENGRGENTGRSNANCENRIEYDETNIGGKRETNRELQGYV